MAASAVGRFGAAEKLAGLAEFLERMLRCEAVQLLPLKLSDRLTLGKRFRHRLAVHLGQLRFVIEAFQVGRSARHVQIDDPLGAGGEMKPVHHAPPTIQHGLAARRVRGV